MVGNPAPLDSGSTDVVQLYVQCSGRTDSGLESAESDVVGRPLLLAIRCGSGTWHALSTLEVMDQTESLAGCNCSQFRSYNHFQNFLWYLIGEQFIIVDQGLLSILLRQLSSRNLKAVRQLHLFFDP